MHLRSSVLLLLLSFAALTPLSAQTWSQSTTQFLTGSGGLVPSVAFGNGTFVAAGVKAASDGSISVYTSTDGSNWTERPVTLTGFTLLGVGKVRFINERFVVFGSGWFGGFPRGYTATSTDGTTWSVNNNSGAINAIHFSGGNGTYVITAGTSMATSTDHGLTWTGTSAPGGGTFNAGWGDNAYSNGRWYMTGEGLSPKWWTSTDGINWTETTAAGTGGARIEAGNGMFIRHVGSYRRSTDGTTFTEISPAPLDNGVNRNLVFFGGRFLFERLVFSGITPTVQFLASTDGLTFSNFGAAPMSTFGLTDAAQGNDIMVAVGTNSATGPNARALVLYSAAVGGGNDPDPQPTLPSITAQPQSQTVASGGSVTFSVTASGTNITYQWKRNGQAITGATSATLTLTNVQSSHTGSYTVDVTNAAGTITSNSVTLTLLTPSSYGRLSAISIRAFVGQGDDVLIAGFATGGGNGSLPLLIRGVGPTLANLGVPASQTLQDPQLSVIRIGQSTAAATNDNWAGDDGVLSAAAALGAQPLASNTSADAAVHLTHLPAGPYTAVVSGKNNTTGIALVEVYAGSDAADAPRLLAISGRSTVGGGNDVLIAGFDVTQASTRVLVRGAGPVLTSVPSRLAHPRIALHRPGVSEPIATNDDWGSASNADEVASLAAQVGAQPFAANSKDAALLVSLDPGVYTVVVSGAGTSSGVALAEVYEVP